MCPGDLRIPRVHETDELPQWPLQWCEQRASGVKRVASSDL